MTCAEYERLTLKAMQAKRWRLTRGVERRDGLSIEAGREVRIVGKLKGVAVESPRCDHCGCAFRVVKLPPYFVEEIKE